MVNQTLYQKKGLSGQASVSVQDQEFPLMQRIL